jgi:hypothetical protein
MRHLLAALLLAGSMMTGFIVTTAGVASQATPEASPAASPEAATGPVVTDYSDIQDAYEAARDEALNQGREIVDTLRSDNADSLLDRMSPQLQELVGEGGLGELIASLESNRVRFFAEEPGMRFDSQLTGDTIEG